MWKWLCCTCLVRISWREKINAKCAHIVYHFDEERERKKANKSKKRHCMVLLLKIVDFWIGERQSFWRLYTIYPLYNYELFEALCVRHTMDSILAIWTNTNLTLVAILVLARKFPTKWIEEKKCDVLHTVANHWADWIKWYRTEIIKRNLVWEQCFTWANVKCCTC